MASQTLRPHALRILRKAANERGWNIPRGTSWTIFAQTLGCKDATTKYKAQKYLVKFLGFGSELDRAKWEASLPPGASIRDGSRRNTRPQTVADVASPEFLRSYEWRALRMKVLDKYGPRCMCCGATPEHGVKMHVDHIKPRRKYPELALSFDNLQVLCEECNHGKGNWNETDWRPNYDASERVAAELMAHIRSL